MCVCVCVWMRGGGRWCGVSRRGGYVLRRKVPLKVYRMTECVCLRNTPSAETEKCIAHGFRESLHVRRVMNRRYMRSVDESRWIDWGFMIHASIRVVVETVARVRREDRTSTVCRRCADGVPTVPTVPTTTDARARCSTFGFIGRRRDDVRDNDVRA